MKKMTFLLPCLVLFLLVSPACNDDTAENPAGTLTINFTGSYDGAPLVMFDKTYPYEDDMALKVQSFQFYVSDIKLLKEENGQVEKVNILDVDYVNFGDIYNEADALNGKNLPDIEIPTGTYTGIEFGFGLTEALNSTSSSDYEVGHPLFDNYWGPQTGYIFFKFEGNGDLEPNGEFTQPLTFHIGGNDNFNVLSFDKTINIENNAAADVSFNIDIHKILVAEDGEYLDFREIQTHHAADSPYATLMSNNVLRAITIAE
jgi:hypothetical protein